MVMLGSAGEDDLSSDLGLWSIYVVVADAGSRYVNVVEHGAEIVIEAQSPDPGVGIHGGGSRGQRLDLRYSRPRSVGFDSALGDRQSHGEESGIIIEAGRYQHGGKFNRPCSRPATSRRVDRSVCRPDRVMLFRSELHPHRRQIGCDIARGQVGQ